MSDEKSQIEVEAIAFANKNKKSIAKERTSKGRYKPEKFPVSVFMAGSPGAGKTESSKALIKSLSGEDSVLRIDIDDLRSEFDKYNGKNSSLFQAPSTIIAEKMHDNALNNKQSFVFDGTLTNYEKSKENIQRSLNKNREVYILYVYQDPIQAWKFVIDREAKDGRSIPKEVFIQQYFEARENVNKLKSEFGSQIQVDLVVKNIDGTDFKYKENITLVDSHVKEKYSKDTLSDAIEHV